MCRGRRAHGERIGWDVHNRRESERKRERERVDSRCNSQKINKEIYKPNLTHYYYYYYYHYYNYYYYYNNNTNYLS